jgi:hypothetical protein
MARPRGGSNFKDPNAATAGAASPKLASGVYVDRKGMKRCTSLSAIFAQLCARLTKEFAGDRSRRKDRLHQIAKVRGVLDERLGVFVPLEDHAPGARATVDVIEASTEGFQDAR